MKILWNYDSFHKLWICFINFIEDFIIHSFDHTRKLEDFITSWSYTWRYLKKGSDDIAKVLWKMCRDSLIISSGNFFIKAFHILCMEWRFKRCHFIEHTTKRSNITFGIIWFIFPDFRTLKIIKYIWLLYLA